MIGLDNVWGFQEVVLYGLGGLVLVICWGCIYAFFRAIFFFIFSKGDEKQIKAAWDSIRYMILGMFLTVMLIFVSPSLLKFMHLQGAENLGIFENLVISSKILRFRINIMEICIIRISLLGLLLFNTTNNKNLASAQWSQFFWLYFFKKYWL